MKINKGELKVFRDLENPVGGELEKKIISFFQKLGFNYVGSELCVPDNTREIAFEKKQR